MPDRHPRARREPPDLRDHFLGHPAELVIAGWWVIVGALLGIAVAIPGASASPSVDRLHSIPLAAAMAITIGVGGALAIAGLLWPGKHLTTAWAIERAGWIIGGAGWTTYLVTTIARYPTALVALSLAAAMVSVAVLRLAALWVVERQVRADLAAVRP